MLADITLGQYYPGNSVIHQLDPRTKILGTLLFIIAIFMATNTVGYVFLCAFVMAVILASRLPVGMVFRSLKPLAFIIILTMALHFFLEELPHVHDDLKSLVCTISCHMYAPSV